MSQQHQQNASSSANGHKHCLDDSRTYRIKVIHALVFCTGSESQLMEAVHMTNWVLCASGAALPAKGMAAEASQPAQVSESAEAVAAAVPPSSAPSGMLDTHLANRAIQTENA